MGVRFSCQSWLICLFYPMIKPFQGELPLEEENPAFPKQHCLTTILYRLALHPPLTRTTEKDEVQCSLEIVGCVRLTEDSLWDLGSREIVFVLSERLLAMVYFSMKVLMVVFQHDFIGPLLYGRKVQHFLPI